jgi:hypothetical protein
VIDPDVPLRGGLDLAMIRWLDGVPTREALAREKHGRIELPAVAISREDRITGDIRTLVIRWPAMITVVLVVIGLLSISSVLP